MLRKITAICVAAFMLAGCSSGGAPAPSGGEASQSASSEPAQSESAEAAQSASPAAAGATKMELWTFQELHVEFYKTMAEKWNAANPDEQIDFTFSPLPYDDMHNKLLVALQSGVGAPDIVDIEIGKFANYLKGTPQLVPINDVLEPELDNIVRSRADIYSKDGQFYGICFHVGAAVIYYNEELLNEAGVDWKTIVTWDDYKAAGKKFNEASGKPWSTMEISDPWHLWPLLASQGGDLLDKDGKPHINSPEMIKALTYNQSLLNEGISIVTPGNNQHSEEFYGLMNGGGVGSIIMPMWYMGRFTDYMPDLAGKIAIAPLPVWEQGQPRSVGLGGTGTVVTNQTKSPELAKKFLAYAKISEEGNIEIWKLMGFDPVRTSTWSMPELRDARPNKFLDYFSTNPFDVLNEIKDEIPAIVVSEALPPTMDMVKNSTLFRVYEEKADPATVLAEDESQIQY
jgi:arabinosaccharide transport system substrate-binding protein